MKPRHILKRTVCFVVLCLSLAAIPQAFAEDAPSLSPEMRAKVRAIMAVCRADYFSHCKGVRPGDGQVLACMQKNISALKPECRDSVELAAAFRNSATVANPPAD